MKKILLILSTLALFLPSLVKGADATVSSDMHAFLTTANDAAARTELGVPATSHTHTESDITDLQSYLLDITGESLSDLSDVTITTIASGELLKWNGTAWVNNTLAEAGIQPLDSDLTTWAGITPSANLQTWLGTATLANLNTLMGTSIADGAHTTDTTLNLAGVETITGNWVNTANPWADNEVSDTLTIGASSTIADGALPFSAAGFSGNLATTDDTLQEVFDALDALSTGGGGNWTDSGTNGTYIRDGTTSTFFDLYRTYTDGSNNAYVRTYFDGDIFTIEVVENGTGAGTVDSVRITTRDGSFTFSNRLQLSGGQYLQLNGSYIEWLDANDPGAASTDRMKTWYEVDGGVNQWVARFKTGPEKVIAREGGFTAAGITASATQTQGQQALTNRTNEIATVATTNDVVTLPEASTWIGEWLVIINNGANTLQIFPASGDNLGAGVDTSTTLAAGRIARFIAYDSTNWKIGEVFTDSRTFTIGEPDIQQGISDDWRLMKFPAEKYPDGVTITSIHIDASAAYTSETFLFEHWDDASGSTQTTVESIACSAISTEDDGTLSDATIPADYFLMVNLDDTPEDVAYVSITVTFTY